MRELVWGKEKGFEGWKCNGCGWLIPNPRMVAKHADGEKEEKAEAKRLFDAHKCKDHPLKPKST